MTKKFRIWSPYHQKFVIEGAEFGLERLFENIYIKIKGTWSRNQDFETPTNVNSYVVQQWTGLTDSQGVEIYEGDILEFLGPEDFSAHYGKAHFEDGMFKATEHGTLYSWRKWITVVGNIFQNPELLEKC